MTTPASGFRSEGFRADCYCGWRGPTRGFQVTANLDARLHRIRTGHEEPEGFSEAEAGGEE